MHPEAQAVIKMGRDRKLPKIELKRDDFNTAKQRAAAEILLQEWPAPDEEPVAFSNLAGSWIKRDSRYVSAEDIDNLQEGDEEFDISRSTFQKSYCEYLGPPGRNATVETLREEYGSIKNYLGQEQHGLGSPHGGSASELVKDMAESLEVGVNELSARDEEMLYAGWSARGDIEE